MVRQVSATTRGLDCVQWLQGEGVDTWVECGPGRVLSGLIKRIDKNAGLHNIQDRQTLEKTVAALTPGAAGDVGKEG
jgi:[acyl-carrier-protein] S-malonyltransferase